MDSYNVTITIKTLSINGKQGGDEIESFSEAVLKAAKELLSSSSLEVDISKHRHFRDWGQSA